ncbi:MAG: hypothetical protein QW290_09430 [Sulfolobales archaeon]
MEMYLRLEPRRIVCKKCGYEWYTRSTLKYVPCPRCRHPNRNPYYVEEKSKGEKNEGSKK